MADVIDGVVKSLLKMGVSSRMTWDQLVPSRGAGVDDAQGCAFMVDFEIDGANPDWESVPKAYAMPWGPALIGLCGIYYECRAGEDPVLRRCRGVQREPAVFPCSLYALYERDCPNLIYEGRSISYDLVIRQLVRMHELDRYQDYADVRMVFSGAESFRGIVPDIVWRELWRAHAAVS